MFRSSFIPALAFPHRLPPLIYAIFYGTLSSSTQCIDQKQPSFARNAFFNEATIS